LAPVTTLSCRKGITSRSDLCDPPGEKTGGVSPFEPVYHLTSRRYTSSVPTTRPRYQITETPAIARALDVAAHRWPKEPRSTLLLRLVHAGSVALEQAQDTAVAARQAAVDASSGKYPEAFGDDYLAELRRDWPE
jgi:hypothetical protein